MKFDEQTETIVRRKLVIELEDDDIRRLHSDLYDIGSNLEMSDYPLAYDLLDRLSMIVQTP